LGVDRASLAYPPHNTEGRERVKDMKRQRGGRYKERRNEKAGWMKEEQGGWWREKEEGRMR